VGFSLPPVPDGSFLMRAILDVLLLAIDLYTWLLIASAIVSWLVAFNIINTRNDFVRAVWDFLYRITEPALRPIRQRLPHLGGIDISPIILFLLLYFIKLVIIYYIRPYVF
jgi:YggT family protein